MCNKEKTSETKKKKKKERKKERERTKQNTNKQTNKEKFKCHTTNNQTRKAAMNTSQRMSEMDTCCTSLQNHTLKTVFKLPCFNIHIHYILPPSISIAQDHTHSLS